jgi:hypothetical protein
MVDSNLTFVAPSAYRCQTDFHYASILWCSQLESCNCETDFKQEFWKNELRVRKRESSSNKITEKNEQTSEMKSLLYILRESSLTV